MQKRRLNFACPDTWLMLGQHTPGWYRIAWVALLGRFCHFLRCHTVKLSILVMAPLVTASTDRWKRSDETM